MGDQKARKERKNRAKKYTNGKNNSPQPTNTARVQLPHRLTAWPLAKIHHCTATSCWFPPSPVLIRRYENRVSCEISVRTLKYQPSEELYVPRLKWDTSLLLFLSMATFQTENEKKKWRKNRFRYIVKSEWGRFPLHSPDTDKDVHPTGGMKQQLHSAAERKAWRNSEIRGVNMQ